MPDRVARRSARTRRHRVRVRRDAREVGGAPAADVELLVLTDGSKGTWDPDADLDRARGHPSARAGATRPPRPRAPRGVHFLGASTASSRRRPRANRRAVCEVIRADPTRRGARSRSVEAVPPPSRPPSCRLAHARRHRRRARPALLPRAAGRAAPPGEHSCCSRPRTSTTSKPSTRAIDAKVEALLVHRSQWRSTMGIEDGTADGRRSAGRVRTHGWSTPRSERRPLARPPRTQSRRSRLVAEV